MLLHGTPYRLPASEWEPDFDPADWSPYLPKDGPYVQHRARRVLFEVGLAGPDYTGRAWHIMNGHEVPDEALLARLSRQAVCYWLAETWEAGGLRRHIAGSPPPRAFHVTIRRDASGRTEFVEVAKVIDGAACYFGSGNVRGDS